MKVLYYTNIDKILDDSIPSIIRKNGDEVSIYSEKLDFDFLSRNGVDFIVSDRSRFLIGEEIINKFERRIVNIHTSLLPWNRGYYPIYWSVKDKTPLGVTLHYIDTGIDTGDIISQIRISHFDGDSLRSLYKKLRETSVLLFEHIWPDLRVANVGSFKQNLTEGSHHFKKDFDGVFQKLPNGWDTLVTDID